MINKGDDRVEEILREVLRLESARLSEPRPRNMPEAVVQIIKKIIPAHSDLDGGGKR